MTAFDLRLPKPPKVRKIMAQYRKKAIILHTFGLQVDKFGTNGRLELLSHAQARFDPRGAVSRGRAGRS